MSKKIVFVESSRQPAVRVYANHILSAKTTYDLRLIFGEVIEADDATITVENRAVVTMAWPEVKALHEIIGQTLAEMESINGEIKTMVLSKPVTPREAIN